MKKRVLLSIVALTVALAAAAQNQAIDKLAAKYADKEGYTVINLEGDMVKEISKMAGNAAKNPELSKMLENVSLVTVLVAETAVPELAEDVKNAVDAVEYNPMVSTVTEGQSVKILTTDIKRGKNKKKKEIVISVVAEDQIVLVRIVGDIDMAALTKMAESMKK